MKTKVSYNALAFWSKEGIDIHLTRDVFEVNADGSLKKTVQEYISNGETVQIETCRSTPIESQEVGVFKTTSAMEKRRAELQAQEK